MRYYLSVAWKFLRKPTTPVHVMYGLVAAFLCFEFGFALGGAMMIGFALWEYWNDKELLARNKIYAEHHLKPAYDERNRGMLYVPEGAMDFWESTVSFLIGLIAIGVLAQLGIISRIGWW